MLLKIATISNTIGSRVMEEVIANPQTSVLAVALVTAVGALWKALRGDHKDRVSALENAVADCMRKHHDCENNSRELSHALLSMIQGQNHQARAKCEIVLKNLARDDDAA